MCDAIHELLKIKARMLIKWKWKAYEFFDYKIQTCICGDIFTIHTQKFAALVWIPIVSATSGKTSHKQGAI